MHFEEISLTTYVREETGLYCTGLMTVWTDGPLDKWLILYPPPGTWFNQRCGCTLERFSCVSSALGQL